MTSKWLDDYLISEAQNKNYSNSLPSEICPNSNNKAEVIYDEDENGKETPEGVDDPPMLEQTKSNFQDHNQDFETQKNEKSSGSDKNEIPVVSYSDDDKSSDELKDLRAAPPHPREDNSQEDNSQEDSDSDEKDDPINNMITKNKISSPPGSEEASSQDTKADMITNELFYQLLADIITDPVPKRDLSIFTLQPQSNFRKIVDIEKKKSYDLLSIEKYLEEVIESIMENESNFIDNLLEPVRRNPIDMLQLLQNSDLGSYEHFDNIALKQPVLSLDLYLDIERNKEEKRLTDMANKRIVKHLENNQDSQENSTEEEDKIEFEQIHRKMIFD